MTERWAWVMGVLVVTGCAVASADTGRAVIRGTSEGSSVSGSATVADTPEGLTVSIHVAGVTPGQHGWHIHQFGECGDGGNAAGGHYNPDGAPHGFLPKDGLAKAHPGDLGNLEVGPDGSGSLTVTLPGVALTSGKYSVAGRTIILHEKVDDFGQPTGNAGGRIGCGSILIAKE